MKSTKILPLYPLKAQKKDEITHLKLLATLKVFV